MQFLLAVSHSVGAHAEALQLHQDSSSSSDDEDIRTPVPRAPTSAASESAAVADVAVLDDDISSKSAENCDRRSG